MARLSDEERAGFLAEHPEWSLDGETIARTFVLADFKEAMGFVTRVALVAEAANHHPDIDIRWKRVTLALTTHEEKALTARDRALATEIDSWV